MAAELRSRTALRYASCDCRPFCGALHGVLNLSEVPIRVEGWFEDAGCWAPLVPKVEPASEHQMHTGVLWLPRHVILRTVNNETGEAISVVGAVGEGRRIVQEPLSSAQATFQGISDTVPLATTVSEREHTNIPGDGDHTEHPLAQGTPALYEQNPPTPRQRHSLS